MESELLPTNEEPIKIINADCLEVLKKLPDNCIDLVLTDPPYGINQDKGIQLYTKASSKHTVKKYKDNWDSKTPSKEIFDEILRVGKKVIIFGGNYFIDKLPFKTSWIIWDKIGNIKFNDTFTDVEMAWTNFDRNISKKYICIQHGFVSEERKREHPTQKPVKLFRNIIKDYSKEGELIMDCFLGSGTTTIACKQLNRKCLGIEISKKYCDIAKKRLQQGVL